MSASVVEVVSMFCFGLVGLGMGWDYLLFLELAVGRLARCDEGSLSDKTYREIVYDS
jgi:hypothetical protein